MDLNDDTITLDDAFVDHFSLWYLLTEFDESLGSPYAPGALVEVIEIHGITGFDRSGRWKKFAPKDRQAIEAVEALEWFYGQGDVDPMVLESRMSLSHALFRYGWSNDSIPPLRDIRDEIEKLVPLASMNKELKSSLRLIGALAAMLLGKTGHSPHPDFDTKEKILGHLEHLAGKNSREGIAGIRETAAKGKINQGLKLIGM